MKKKKINYFKDSNRNSVDVRAAVAQELRAVVWQQEGCRFDPRGSAYLSVEVSLSKTPP